MGPGAQGGRDGNGRRGSGHPDAHNRYRPDQGEPATVVYDLTLENRMLFHDQSGTFFNGTGMRRSGERGIIFLVHGSVRTLSARRLSFWAYSDSVRDAWLVGKRHRHESIMVVSGVENKGKKTCGGNRSFHGVGVKEIWMMPPFKHFFMV